MIKLTHHQCLEDSQANWARLRQLPQVRRTVVSIWGRKQAPFRKAEIDGNPVLINELTGQVYRDGKCLSSPNLRLL